MGANFLTQPIQYGVGGLNLSKALDALTQVEKSRWLNLVHTSGGSETIRPGYTAVGQIGLAANVHSLRRLNAQTGAPLYARIYGADHGVYIGEAGDATLVSAGFSGDPLTMVPHRSKNGGDSWMYLGDSLQPFKVRIDGLGLPIGLPKPLFAATALAPAPQKTTIENFEAGFAAHAGGGGGGVPNLTYPAGKNGNCLNMETVTGAATGPYYSFADKVIAVNLNTVGTLPASDDDLIHVWIKLDRPDLVQEVRIYFTLAQPGTFVPGVLPGLSTTDNTQCYMKAFRPNDDTSFNVTAATAITSATVVQSRALTDDALNSAINDGFLTDNEVPRTDTVAERLAAQDQARLASLQTLPGLGQWTEFGVIGIPLRRGDFKRNGTDDTLNWENVQGITVYVMTNSGQPVNASFDTAFLIGGFPLDSATPGTQPYEWVYTNVDPRTGAESNYGPTMPIRVDALRSQINVTPTAIGDANIIQRFYRKGGSIIDNWYFDGDNAGDGLAFAAVLSDDVTFGTGITAPVDNDQPVTTKDAAGNEIFAAPVSVIFGPISDMLVAVGDVNRPGFMYWSNPGDPDSWSSDNQYEVCGASEALMAGAIYGSQGFVGSTEMLYMVIPNLQTQGGLTAVPTACKHGLVSRTAMAVGTGGIYIGSKDGIYRTGGGDPGIPITDEIRGLFEGQTVNGYLPIDFGFPNQIRLAEFNNDLWFGYQDSGGTQRWLLYSLLYRYWRPYDFATGISAVYSEEGVPLSLLMGGRTSGKAYTQGGTTDDGSAIAWLVRSGTLNEGDPRIDKRYGQVQVQIQTGNAGFTATGYLEDEEVVYGPKTLAEGRGRQAVYVDLFDGAEVTARNLALELAGVSRDGLLTLWVSEFAYETEPADYTQWATDPIGLGGAAWKRLIRMTLGYRAQAAITLQVEAFNQTGTVLATQTYTIPSTSGQKVAADVPFQKIKGILFRFSFSSPGAFRIYEEEGAMEIVAMNGAATVRKPVFGTRDYDSNSPLNPLLAAIRPGGAQ